jgi:molybdopterin synthase catalytic subunit
MIALSREPLDTDAPLRAVEDPEHGGVVVFIGATRAEAARRTVAALEYDAHEALALAEMARIADDLHARYGARVAMLHRLGRVEPGQPSVVVAAGAAHRAEAFAACRDGIDRLKASVPIWKCTHFADGGREWDQ